MKAVTRLRVVGAACLLVLGWATGSSVAAGAWRPGDRAAEGLSRRVARLEAQGKGKHAEAVLRQAVGRYGNAKAGLRAQVLQAQRALGRRKGDEAKA
ncbi:MAG: hypothetical protein GW892_34295, partial [Armatimonadetes bacterium]|nr:hypothetical protein [Armatimonadota bacterium]